MVFLWLVTKWHHFGASPLAAAARRRRWDCPDRARWGRAVACTSVREQLGRGKYQQPKENQHLWGGIPPFSEAIYIYIYMYMYVYIIYYIYICMYVCIYMCMYVYHIIYSTQEYPIKRTH